MNNYNFGWDHYASLSWEASDTTLHSPQVQRSSLEETMIELAKVRAEMENSRVQIDKSSLQETMVELRKGQADLAMVQAKNKRSTVELDYLQKDLPKFHAQNVISPPPQ